MYNFSRSLLTAISCSLILLGACNPAKSASDARIFERLAGSWSGAGTVKVAGGSDERIRCRADYVPSNSTQVRLMLRCASDGFNLQVVSDVTRDGDRILGTWAEATTGVSGDLTGSVSADRINASTEGAGFSARISIAVRGTTQNIQLISQGPTESTASVALRRE